MRKLLVLLIFIMVGASMYWLTKKAIPQGDSAVDRGRYLVQVAGCNDCHTRGYAEKAGKIAEKEWLTGDTLGWQGPWGTTYPINLRSYMQSLTQDQWVQVARRVRTRPPMPYYILHQMKEEDLRAIFLFIRELGPGGQPAPVALPPGVAATTPVFRLAMPGQ